MTKPSSLGRIAICTLLIVAVFSSLSFARLATAPEMEQVAQNWLTQRVALHGSWSSSTTPNIRQIEPLIHNNVLLGHIYHIAPGGFVVVPILKEMTPIKAYSDQYDLNADQEGGFMLMLKEQLYNRMTLYEQQFGSLDAEQPTAGEALFSRSQTEQWDRLTQPTKVFESSLANKAADISEAGPICTTSWHQSAPYNDYCPMGETGRSVVGCVATAASQILAYWNWPPSGVGSHSYTWDGDQYCGGDYGGGVITGDFSDTYDWDNIADNCFSGCTSAQENAVAELCFETGVAFNMDYSSCGSAAATSLAAYVFPTYFKYKPTTQIINRNEHTLSEYYSFVQTEIDNGRPIQYRINLHSIVVDGYREQTPGTYEYHMNYGWANSFNAWYVFDSLYCGWIDGDVCPADEEFMIIGIEPQTDPVLSLSGYNLNESGDNMLTAGETFDLLVNVANNGWDASNVTVNISSSDPNLTVSTPSAVYPNVITWGEISNGSMPLEMTVAPSCPDPYLAKVMVTISADGFAPVTDSIYLCLGATAGMADDIEAGEEFWRHQPFTNQFGDQWHRETYRKHSGSYSWKVGGDGSAVYANSLDAALITPPFVLPVNPVLTFWHWRDIEDNSSAWDGGILMISTDGTNWEQITPEGGYPDAIVDNPANTLPGGTPCYSGTVGWEEAIFNLSGYSGMAQIMFRMTSDGLVTQEGWYVDDIEVSSLGCCVGIRGNIDNDPNQIIEVTDLVYFVDYQFRNGDAPACLDEADIKVDGVIDVADLVFMVDYQFRNGDAPPACPY